MKKSLLLFAILLSFTHLVKAQCTPNSLFGLLGLPGVYPPELAIPSIPMVGINDGTLGSSYSQTLTLVVLEDTTMDVALFLPSAVVSSMSSASIPTVMSLSVNYVTFDIAGLPNGLSYTCDQSNCEYPSGADGCILINGNPNQSGNFSVPVNMIINAQIPAITDPLFGTTLFAGMAIDLPSFSAVEYDLLVTGATAINEVGSYSSKIFPNPTAIDAMLCLYSVSDVVVYNVFGKKVFTSISIEGNLVLSKADLGEGMFYIMITSENKTETIKLIIK